MAGTNYMGGKRHAAKARSRDVSGRLQKGFFGRQRIAALTNGLKQNSTLQNAITEARQDIELAHARRNNPKHDDVVPEQRIKSSDFPEGRRSPSTKSSSSTSSKRSRLIEALNASEPVSMRAAMDQILAQSDLAGLSNVNARRRKLISSPRRSGSTGAHKNIRSTTTSPTKMRSEDFSDDHSTYEEYYVSDFSVPLNDISISNSSSQPNSRPTANKQSRLSRVFGAYLSDPLPVSEEYADRHRYPDHVIADERYPSDTDNRQTLSASIPSPGSYGNGLGNAQGRSVRYAALAFLGEYSEHGSSEVSRPRDRSSGPSGAEAPGKRVEWGMHWEKSRSPPSSASAGYVLTSDLNTSALPYRPQQFSPTYFRDPDRPQCLPSGEREVSSGLTSPPTYRDVSSRSREDTTGPSSPYLVSSVKSLDHNDAHRNIIVDILESPDPWASISELLGTTRRTGLPRSPRRYPNELDVVNGNSRRGVGYRSPRHYEESSDLGIAHKPGPLVLEPVRAKVPEPIPTLSPIPAGPYPEDELNWDLSSPMPGSQAYVVAPDYMRSPDILDLSWMDDSQADVSDILAMWRSGSVEDLDFLADHTTTEDLSVPLPLQDPGLANTGPTIQPAPGDEVVALRSPPATTQLDPRTSSPPAAGRFPLDDPIPLAQDSPMAPILSAPLIAVLQEHRHSPPITFTQESRTPSHRNPVCSGIAPFEGVYEAFDETHKQNVEGSHPDDSQQQVEDEVFQGPCLFFDEMDDREED